MNTNETLEQIVTKLEEKIRTQGTANHELLMAYCLAVIARRAIQ